MSPNTCGQRQGQMPLPSFRAQLGAFQVKQHTARIVIRLPPASGWPLIF